MSWSAFSPMPWLLRHVQIYWVLVTVFSLLAGVSAASFYRSSDEASLRHVLEVTAQRHAVQLSEASLRGRAMGAAAMLGINETVLKQLAQGGLPSDARQTVERLRPVWRALDAEAIYILDADGRVVADVSDHPASTGQRWQDKPFWQQAFAGQETVYPMAEGDVPHRFVILAAPIYTGAERGGNVIGVVAIKLSAQGLDVTLRRIGVHALLLSPQGLVFASSEAGWNFSLAHAVDAETVSALHAQFGPTFGAGVVQRFLPFDPASETGELLGVRHLRVRASLQWPDAFGRWQLVLLATPGQSISTERLVVLGGGVFLLVFGVSSLVAASGRNRAARQLALTRSEAASREVMALAQIKARQSDLTLRLQGARDLPTLARTLFAELGRFLPVHQGSLYFVDTIPGRDPELLLAGSYATADAPASLSIGDGLVGQCALERRALVYRDVPSGFWRIESGLGQALPRSLLLLPVMRSDTLIGVLELASMDRDCSGIESTLEGLQPVLAMNLEILLTERRLEHLLTEARAQAAAQAAVCQSVTNTPVTDSQPAKPVTE